jgi:hypothetical protein
MNNNDFKMYKKKFITREFVKAHPKWLFCFGDNEERVGLGGQAKAMRGEPNAHGIRTKALASSSPVSYWYDTNFDANIRMIEDDFSTLYDKSNEYIDEIGFVWKYEAVVFPVDGFGTGLAYLEKNAPNTFRFLEDIIIVTETIFDYDGEILPK